MPGHFNLKESIIWVIVFLETESVLALIALSDISLFCVHLNRFFWLVLLWISISLFLLFISCQLFVHLPTRLPRIGWFLLGLLLSGHMFLELFPLFFIILLLSELQLTLLDGLKKTSFEWRQQLLSFDSLRRSHSLAIIALESEDMGDHVIFATDPTLARISC